MLNIKYKNMEKEPIIIAPEQGLPVLSTGGFVRNSLKRVIAGRQSDIEQEAPETFNGNATQETIRAVEDLWTHAESFEELNIAKDVHSGRYNLIDLDEKIGGITGYDDNGMAHAAMFRVGEKTYSIWHVREADSEGARMLITDEAYNPSDPDEKTFYWLNSEHDKTLCLPGKQDGQKTPGIELAISKMEIGYKLQEGAPNSQVLHRKFDNVLLEEHQQQIHEQAQLEWEASAPEREAAHHAKLEQDRANREIKLEKHYKEQFKPIDPNDPDPNKAIRAKVKPDSLPVAINHLHGLRDTKLFEIIEQFVPVANIQAIPEQIRSNVDLRYALGKFMIDYVDYDLSGSSMAPQPRQDYSKSPAFPGYGTMRSREYVVLLALSKLDGTFDVARADNVTATYDTISDDGGGQHRWTANQLLHSIKNDAQKVYVPDTIFKYRGRRVPQ